MSLENVSKRAVVDDENPKKRETETLPYVGALRSVKNTEVVILLADRM